MDAKHSLGEPRVLISRAALRHNARLLRRTLPAEVRICAIVKAEAYGHGAAVVADALCQGPDGPAVDALAVASLDEAEALPDVPLPVIVFRPVENVFIGRQRQKLETAIRSGWGLTLCSPAAADDLARIALACGRRAVVQVMVDTGMTRSGVLAARLHDLLHKIDSRPSLRLAGICTHFASADVAGDPHTIQQLDLFHRSTDDVATALRGKILRHAANSAAIFFTPESHLDMVRPGISLYGIDPTGRPVPERPLRPALKWTAALVGIKSVPKGAAVGYGRTWEAPRETRIGLVPVGYADGYPRHLSNRAFVMIHDRQAPVVGRISMDLMTIDLGNIPQAAVGDEVVLLDNDPQSPVSAYEMARWSETIPYEVFCRIGPRVQRVATDPVEEESPASQVTTTD